jgi:hypothetical protein
VCSTKAILLIFYGDNVEIKNITKSSLFLVLNITEMVGGCMYSYRAINIMQTHCTSRHIMGTLLSIPLTVVLLSPWITILPQSCSSLPFHFVHSCKFFLPLHTFHSPLFVNLVHLTVLSHFCCFHMVFP